jgi:hypothetical protein
MRILVPEVAEHIAASPHYLQLSLHCHIFAMSALVPSAAIVKAARQIDLAPSGNVANSFPASLAERRFPKHLGKTSSLQLSFLHLGIWASPQACEVEGGGRSREGLGWRYGFLPLASALLSCF